ncbi:hypothetical protein TMS3_0110310 [Pseudomonas taeanensis MS-3]|uniref:Uncharacterized protein n=1 Tax=Pseudomonas taeanensis MS-3 TaxID=1395571 RepID=A0A0A1YLH9_9PSED|nr:hypothetical protein [Pseudomonas taeanensis]KFX69896.1 hypothetical protein TMS3_0110310 [Pseudomonas taeanensis MS-3]
MGFNEEELTYIKIATSGFLKFGARKKIAGWLKPLAKKLEELKTLSATERDKELKEILNLYTAARQEEVRKGARNHGHAGWAAAAACESWVQEILGGNEQSIKRVEIIIFELIRRG